MTAAADDPSALADIPYDSLVVDRKFGPFAETVSADMAGRLAGTIGVAEPVSSAPPAVFPVLFLKALRRAMGGIPAGSILARQELEFHAPLPVDREVQITSWVGDKQVRRERPFVTIEFDIRDESGAQIVTGRKIVVWPSGPGERA
jgi:acyl dehydratase